VRPDRSLGAWGAGARLARFQLRRYVPGGLLWSLEHTLPLFTGLLLKAVFDRVSGDRPAYGTALSLVALLVAAELGRALVFWSAMAYWPAWWRAVASRLQANVLESVLCAPGPPSTRLPGSPGEAIGRFRDDVEDMVWFVDVWVDIVGGAVLAVVAVAVMVRISPIVTLVVVAPMVGVLAGTRALGRLLRRSHLRLREHGSSVTDLIADLFGGVLALKAAGAEERALARFRARNASRRRAAVRAQLAHDLMGSVGGLGAQIGTGLVLLVAAGALRDRSFTVGDLALFTSYASSLTGLSRWLGRLLAYHREAGVALQRLARLQPDRRPEQVVAPGPVWLTSSPPPVPAPAADPEDRLRRLEVRGLTARHPASGRGVEDVDFAVRAGALVVITGAVGSGKSTLVRALLGLLPIEAGTILWNGRPVDDPGTFLVPPRTAYASQVTRLFSATLEENLELGWPARPDQLWSALGLAQLDREVAEMHLGPATVVGPRGSRLSGGQAQRAAVARAVLREPDLLVLDDVSSALDLRTEERLWEALRARGTACLATGHRRAVLERADHIVVLEAGRVAAAGSLDELRRASPEFQRLWRPELLGGEAAAER
jgi:ATP-binding cassette subfamily B protein